MLLACFQPKTPVAQNCARFDYVMDYKDVFSAQIGPKTAHRQQKAAPPGCPRLTAFRPPMTAHNEPAAVFFAPYSIVCAMTRSTSSAQSNKGLPL